MTVRLAKIPRAYHLPRIDWDVVGRWIAKHVPQAEQPQAWTDIVDQWLDRLDRALGKKNRAMLSENLLLFAPGNFQQMEQLLDFGEAGLKEILSSLGDLATESRRGPIVLLLFADDRTYGRYTSPFDPAVGAVQSAGMCFRSSSLVHVALKPAKIESLQRTVLHEITHACLGHLSLPLWLEEGITQLAEEAALPDWARFKLSSEEAAAIREFWREQGLSEFWWGTGFFAIDGMQQFSYQLAQVMFRIITTSYKQRLPEFVRRACEDDAGESAARDVLGKGLAEIAQQFLGPGNWEPVPPDGATYARRGALFLARKQFDKALSDFDHAIELEPQASDLLITRGAAHYVMGNDTSANADYLAAIKLDPKNFSAHNNLAWNLATNSDAQFRDGEKAVEHATKACELCDYSQWYCLGTLGAAHAEAGDFEEALRWTQEASLLAPATERADCAIRISLFNSGEAYRDLDRHVVDDDDDAF
ncbi:MAG: peptidase superfamily protein [Planctomycetaceae bacterium]|nr:peptidase superfamily protein [Planctomycetaceae bacterium]